MSHNDNPTIESTVHHHDHHTDIKQMLISTLFVVGVFSVGKAVGIAKEKIRQAKATADEEK